MKEKAIRKMSREELLELLIQYSEEKEALELRVIELEGKLREAQEKLKAREIAISNAGSLAEAAIQISGVFEAAQRAADLYLENVRKMDAPYKKEGVAHEATQIDLQKSSTRRRKRGLDL